MANTPTGTQRDFRPFIPECAKFGIARTKAYELADAGLLETFSIGKKRFVFLDSLYSLPGRITSRLTALDGLEGPRSISAAAPEGVSP